MKINTLLLAFLIIFSTGFTFGSEVKITVTLHEVTDYGTNKEFAYKAAKLLENVLNSDEFKTEVLKAKFKATNGFTNQQLYDKIMIAREEDGPGGTDGVVDLRARTLRIYSDESNWKKPCENKTIGVDGAGTGVTAICPQKLEKWAKDNNADYLAAHYAHEYAHILGFSHSGGNKNKTFVYQIGDIIEKLAGKMIKEQANS